MSSITSWKYTIQAVPSKKKKASREKGKENEMEKGENKEKGRMRCGRKEEREEERMKEKEKEKKKRGRERRIENRESNTRSVPPSPDTFPSMKLGNNIPLIKGRLGKNTTPISRDPTELNQNPQVNPPQRRSSLDTSYRTYLIYTPGRAESLKYGFHSNGAAIYKKAKAHGNSRSRF